ncbi:MAG: class I SAM-dependent methyltransferase [Candidatus Saccharimonadales bacterium]
MSETNNKTLATYEERTQKYIDGTAQEVTLDGRLWIDYSLAGLGADARILEIGSAFGRDADYIESQGFSVERTDATKSFVALLQSRGQAARELNLLTDKLGAGHDLILANAVLLHFSRPEASAVTHKIYDALKAGGRFAFTVKAGYGESWSYDKMDAPRFYCYWQPDQLEKLLYEANFQDNLIENDTSGKWLQVIARKGLEK